MSLADPTWDSAKGVWRHTLDSPYQRGSNAVEVLLPDGYSASTRCRVLYVLPVETGLGGRYGDGLQEVRRANLHNRCNLICVTPAFETLPWHGAHASDPTIRHEQHVRDALVPAIESRHCVVAGPAGRLLLGFSKSGWGAFTLLLRNPEVFGCACSWDAPLMLDLPQFGEFGTDGHFGTRENFAGYLPRRLLQERAQLLRDRTRLVLLGSWSFGPEPRGEFKDRPHTLWAHEYMLELGVRHDYSDELHLPHDWHSGWVAPAVSRLMSIADGE